MNTTIPNKIVKPPDSKFGDYTITFKKVEPIGFFFFVLYRGLEISRYSEDLVSKEKNAMFDWIVKEKKSQLSDFMVRVLYYKENYTPEDNA